MSKPTNLADLRTRLVDGLLDSQSAAHSVRWLFDRYDDGHHEMATETARLLISLMADKLSDLLCLAETLGVEVVHG